MRRVVFDCDRCGRKDLPEVFGPYNRDGESDEYRLDEAAQSDAVLLTGHTDVHVTRITYVVLDQLEVAKNWQHFCRKCFRTVTDGVSRMLTPPKPTGGYRKRKEKKVEEPSVAKGPVAPAVKPKESSSGAGDAVAPKAPKKGVKKDSPVKGQKKARKKKTVSAALKI